MPSSQLFVDSDLDSEENDIDSGDDENGDDLNSNEDDIGGENKEEEASGKGKKRKGKENNRAAKKSKKAKKLGPKEEKGKRSEKLTKEEIKELTAKEYAQYSNLYNVQIEEVLEETAISDKRKNGVLEWLDEFKNFVGKLAKSKPFSVHDYEKFIKPIKLPLPENVVAEQKESKVRWYPPSSVDLRGSWATETALNKVSSVDVFLEMSYDYLVKSDTLNHRYHLKRAIYLAFLAKKLIQQRGDVIKFSLANGQLLKPVLSLHVNKVNILIHAVPEKGYFPIQKLACERNNLRYDHFFRKAKPEDEPDSSTQHYNFTILEDSLTTENHAEIIQFLSDKPQFQSAIKLLKIWLTQRELSKGFGGFSGFLVTQLFRYLLKSGKIHETMTVFQIIRVFFVNIIQMDLCENGISFSTDEESIRMVHMQWDVVFLDSTGLLNFTANMSKYTYKRIQQEARRALTIIDGANVTGFLALFVTKVNFMMNFDHVVCLSKLDRLKQYLNRKLEDQAGLLNHSGFIYPLVVSTVGSLFEKCLGSRITILDYQIPNTPEWSTGDLMPVDIPEVIRVGLNVNRELSLKLIEKCEAESEQEIEEFKEFWGERSELRRFKDGTLLESVALENLVKGFGKTRICYQMLHHVLLRHLNYPLSRDEYIDQQLEAFTESKYIQILSSPSDLTEKKKIYLNGKFLKEKVVKREAETEQISVDVVTRYVSSSFDELSKILRQLEELPLQISTVQGTSSVLRFSHIQPTPPQTYFQCKVLTEIDPKKKAMLLRKSVPVPGSTKTSLNESEETITEEIVEDEAQLPTKVPKYVEPVCVIIHLETSGKWPDNMEAIERLKCAFLIKIGQLLAENFGLTVQPYSRHLDVLKDGIVFRIRITYFRELTLLRQLRGPDGVLRTRDNPESLRLEKESLILPQLTSTLHSFHLQYEAFGTTCRIAKRWVASQLLLSSPMEYNRNLEDPDCRLSEEAIELLVAYLFLNYAPHLCYPSEAHVGFIRFLYFLSNTDFRALPIIVNFNDKLTYQDVADIEIEFVKIRPRLPPLFISTPFDKQGSVWTRYLSPVVLGRLQLLAKQALSVAEYHFGNGAPLDFDGLRKLFTAATSQFDVLIKLKSKMNPRLYQNVDNLKNPLTFHRNKKEVNEYIPVVEFDPVQIYLTELRNTFGHMAIFLHDLFGGQYIAVVWKPDVFKACNLTGSSVKGRQLGKDADSIVANVNGALEAFEIMGEGLVDSVHAQSENWKFED